MLASEKKILSQYDQVNMIITHHSAEVTLLLLSFKLKLLAFTLATLPLPYLFLVWFKLNLKALWSNNSKVGKNLPVCL